MRHNGALNLLRKMMQTRPRLVASCFGMICALLIALMAAIAGEFYLRWREREQVVHERHVEAAPEAKTIPDAHVARPSGPPKTVLPDAVISNDVGDITPNDRRIYEDDPLFGYKHVPNTRGTEIKRSGKKEIYRATYTIDALGRRVTPQPEAPPPERAVLAVGCSFTFGLCVNDDQTMPWQLAMRLPDRAVYNYGVAGYGPQHTLELFKKNIEKDIPQKKAAAVYTYIGAHIDRAAGTPGLVRWYAGPFPWYEIDEVSGRPVRKGTFSERGSQPSKSGSKLLEAVRDSRGGTLTLEDAKLTALLLDEARVLFEKAFESEGFYFLVYPKYQNSFTDEVLKILKAGGAQILDYRHLVDKEPGRWFIRGDAHPTPELHLRIAETLAEDLSAVDGR